MIEELKPYERYQPVNSRWIPRAPSHWEVTKLRALTTPRSERNRPDLPLLSVARERGVFVRTADDENHNFVPDDLSNYKVARAGALVINKMKAWQGSMGIAPTDGIVSPAYFVYDLRVSNRVFGQALLRSRPYVAHFAQASDGVRVGQWDLSINRMREIPVLLPPPEEQAAIVRFLDHANRRIDQFIRAKKKLIALLNEQKQAIIHRAVTRGLDPCVELKDSGVPWLGEIPAHWEVRRLKFVTSLQRGYDLPGDRRIPGPYPVVSSGGMIDTHHEFRSEGPGVVLGRYGSTEAVFYVESHFWPHNTSLFVTNYHGNNRRWAYYLLRSLSKGAHSGKSAVPGVDRKDLHEIVVPVPPTAEQVRIASEVPRRVADVDATLRTLERQLEMVRAYRTRLISDVVTGQLDVRTAAASLPAVEPEAELTDAEGDEEPDIVDDEAIA